MKKHLYKLFLTSFVAVSSVVLFEVTSCSVSSKENGTSSDQIENIMNGISVTLPSDFSRKAYYTISDVDHYNVTLFMNGSFVFQQQGKPAQTLVFKISQEGTYSVSVMAVDSSGRPIADGESAQVQITMEDGIVPLTVNVYPRIKDSYDDDEKDEYPTLEIEINWVTPQ